MPTASASCTQNRHHDRGHAAEQARAEPPLIFPLPTSLRPLRVPVVGVVYSHSHVDRADLNRVMMGVRSFDDLIKAGKAKFDGDRKPFEQLRGLLVSFTPDFEILPGAAPKAPAKGPKPFEIPDLLPPDSAGD